MIPVISAALFVLVCIICFTLPGILLLEKNKILFTTLERVIVGTIIGFVLFTLVAYLLLVANISILLLPIIGILDIFSIKNIIKTRISISLPPIKQSLILSLIFIVGIAGQIAITAPSGTNQGKNLVFWSSNGHDGPWHIALMEEIKKGYPLQNPIFAGEKLVNYHFFSDIAPAQFNKYFNFSNLDLYFRFFPLLFSILLGSTAYLLGRKIGGTRTSGIWSAFFVYFGGSFGYFVTWLQNHTIGGESIFWATQVQSSIGNTPQIISDILIFTFLYLFMIYLSWKNWYIFSLCVLLIGTLAEFKIYASIVVVISIGVVGLIQFIRDRKAHILSLFFSTGILSAILYLPNSSNTTSFLIFEPWWFIRTMIVAPTRLNWLDLELKRQTYIAEGNWKRVLQIELTGLLIFFFGNLGTRFLGLMTVIKFLKNSFSNYLYQLILLITIISFILPMLFLQKGVAGNTIQFLQYFLLLFGLLAALTITQIQDKLKSKLFNIFFVVLIILFSVPTQIGLLYDFYHKPPLAKITYEELEALNFLRQNTDKASIILTPPYDKYLYFKTATPNIWAWSDTAYVAAFSSRRTYLADTEQAEIMGYDISNRLETEKDIFIKSDNPTSMDITLRQLNIDYLYFPKILKPKLDLSKSKLKKAFDNGNIEIWKVD